VQFAVVDYHRKQSFLLWAEEAEAEAVVVVVLHQQQQAQSRSQQQQVEALQIPRMQLV
jgi:hypothetical protein